ncbi:unnamed protein product [Blepharisma stoltei]|uniref:Peroxisomal membrane protein 4 n=1 Tax=Blepharisma stoltei TaxID=1481888 RepID=A0AAU9IK62_9CILI|nr:unnamed protein product [Blepharisma stoltei]
MPQERLCKHKGPCWENTLRGFVMAFLQSLAAKSALHILLNFILRKGYRNPIKSLLSFISIDTLRFVGFASLMNSMFKASLCLLRNFRQKEDGLNYVISGGISGLAILVEDPGRRETWALYFFARFLDIILRRQGKQYGLDVNKIEVFLFMAMIVFMIYCYGSEKDNMLKSYYSFLNILFQPSKAEKACMDLWSQQAAEKMPIK